jgi:hypothetical protein
MLRFRRDRGMERLIPRRAAAVWWQSMPELSLGSPTFRCRFIRKGFNSIPQVVRSSSISPSHIRSQLWIADQESWRQPGPSRSPATISQWRSVETRNRSSPFSATPRSSACSRSKTVRSCPAWRRTFQLKPHSFRPRCDPQARERLTRPLEARPDFTFCAGGDWAAWLES